MIVKVIAGVALAFVVQTASAQPTTPVPAPRTLYSQCLHGRVNHRFCQCGTDNSQNCGPDDYCDFRAGAGTCVHPKTR